MSTSPSLVLLQRGVCYDQCHSKTVSLWPASFFTTRPNLTVTPGISWLSTFAFQSAIMVEKEMATHSSILIWKIPWMEEPGRLSSMGSQRVGYDWATSLSLFTLMHWRRKWQCTPVFLPSESQGRRAWCAAVYGVAQSRTRLKRLSSSSSKYSWGRSSFYSPVTKTKLQVLGSTPALGTKFHSRFVLLHTAYQNI